MAQRCTTCNDVIPYGPEAQCTDCRQGKSPEARRVARAQEQAEADVQAEARKAARRPAPPAR